MRYGLAIGILCLCWTSLCEANQTAQSEELVKTRPQGSTGETVLFPASASDRPEPQTFVPRVGPLIQGPADERALHNVEVLLDVDDLDKSYRRYLRAHGDSESFAEYMLNYATKKYKSGRRRIVFGSILSGVAALCFAGAGILIYFDRKHDDNLHGDDMGGILPAATFWLGGGALSGGILLLASGLRRKQKYGLWKDRLNDLVHL